MFSSSEIVSGAAMARITDIRINDPEYGLRAARARKRRERLAPAGKLNILAADHPARRVTKVGGNPIAMADRQDYLARIVRVLSAPAVDGLMATMDLLEDLFILDSCRKEAGAPALLDGKLLIGSLNRGGLAGTAWELDDPVTGATPGSCAAWHLDGAKMLLRIADGEAGSLKTMLECSQAINDCNTLKLPMFLEPLPVQQGPAGWVVQKDAESLARIAGVASALGNSSRHLWLKLPYCDGYETVARATTLPILLLGGESAGDPAPFLSELAAGLRAGPNVRGALVGRNVLYPGAEDPLSMAQAVGRMIHQNWTVEQALASLGR